MISFKVSKADSRLIEMIVTRAVTDYARHGIKLDRLSVSMDIIATHANGCPLDLQRLLEDDDFNFAHDITGINRHLDRDDSSPTAGQMLDRFLPRFAAKDAR